MNLLFTSTIIVTVVHRTVISIDFPIHLILKIDENFHVTTEFLTVVDCDCVANSFLSTLRIIRIRMFTFYYIAPANLP